MALSPNVCVALWQQLVPLIFLTLYLLSGRGTKSNVGPRLRPAASIQPLWDLRYRLNAGDYMYLDVYYVKLNFLCLSRGLDLPPPPSTSSPSYPPAAAGAWT